MYFLRACICVSRRKVPGVGDTSLSFCLKFIELVTIVRLCPGVTWNVVKQFGPYLADCQGPLLHPRAVHRSSYLCVCLGIRERDSLADLVVHDDVDGTRTRVTYAAL